MTGFDDLGDEAELPEDSGEESGQSQGNGAGNDPFGSVEPEHTESELVPPSEWTKFIPIPTQFHSVELSGPFTNCLNCERELLHSNTTYLIEKIYRANEVIIEMAICLECRQGQEEDAVSQESKEAIEAFFDSRPSLVTRPIMMTRYSDTDEIDPWLSRCLLDDTPLDGMREFQTIALCHGDQIQRDFLPAAISGSAMEALSEILSEKTKGWMDDFIGDNFGLPSEFCEPPKFTPMLF